MRVEPEGGEKRVWPPVSHPHGHAAEGGSGKSLTTTILHAWLQSQKIRTVAIDGDNENSTLSRFLPESRFIDMREQTAIDSILAPITADEAEVVLLDSPPILSISLALAKPDETEYTFAKSEEVKEILITKLASFPKLNGVTEYWLFETLGTVKRSLLPGGSVAFDKGVPAKILDKGPYGPSLFVEACREGLKLKSKTKKAKAKK